MMPDTRLKFCPTCQKEKQKSRMRIFEYIREGDPKTMFWDEEGQFHTHDNFHMGVTYECTNAHKWDEWEPYTLCWCGWPNEPRTEGEG